MVVDITNSNTLLGQSNRESKYRNLGGNANKRIVLILFLCIIYGIVSISYMAINLVQIDMNEMNEVRKCKNLALILFGAPVHFKYVWKLYMKNIVKRNPHIHFEAYMHMYSDLHKHPFTSVRNKIDARFNSTPEAPDVIREILHDGSVPAKMTTSPQTTFDELDLLWLTQSDTRGFWGYPLQTLKNIFRQGNSLQQSFLQQQDQKKHSNYDIDLYIFARSDTILMTPIDIPCTGIGYSDIWIPSWGNWTGVNDRFAIAGPHAAKIYASRMDGYKEAILANRAKATALKRLKNSESMLKNWLEQNSLNVTLMGDDWARLSRVRVHGVLQHTDHASHIEKLFNGTKQLGRKGDLHDVHVAAVAEKLLGSDT